MLSAGQMQRRSNTPALLTAPIPNPCLHSVWNDPCWPAFGERSDSERWKVVSSRAASKSRGQGSQPMSKRQAVIR
jgi:hypothetical protein